MNERMQLALDRSRNRPELNKGDAKQFLPQAKLDGETEAQYVERLTAEYKAKASETTPPALMARAVSFIQAMASKVFELPATEEMQAARLNTCYSCEFFQVALDSPEQIGHCATCGCGKNKMTSLPEKAKILKSSCPKGYWDVSISTAPDAEPSFSRRGE
jgi:hypothetical protein